MTAATASNGVVAFGILEAAMGEPKAWALWNRWNAEQRDEVSAFADQHFGPVVRGICDELVAWATEDGTQNG